MRKISLFTLSILCIGTLPVMAQLGNVWSDFQSYAVDLQNYLKNNVSTTLQPLESETLTAIDDGTGEINIPNPIVSGQRVSEDITINSLSEIFENNSAIRSRLVRNEIDRFLTRGAVEGLFGENGQIRTRAKLENTEQSVENITRFATEAQESYSNILNEISANVGRATGTSSLTSALNSNQANLQLQTIKIQTEQSKMIAENMLQTMQVNNSLQYSNLNLANISQQLEAENRSRRVDASAEAARLLRNVSQIDLLGRGEFREEREEIQNIE